MGEDTKFCGVDWSYNKGFMTIFSTEFNKKEEKDDFGTFNQHFDQGFVNSFVQHILVFINVILPFILNVLDNFVSFCLPFLYLSFLSLSQGPPSSLFPFYSYY